MNTNTYEAITAGTSATTLQTWPTDRTWLKVSAGKVAIAQMRQEDRTPNQPATSRQPFWPSTNGRAEEKLKLAGKSFAVAAFVVSPNRRAMGAVLG